MLVQTDSTLIRFFELTHTTLIENIFYQNLIMLNHIYLYI